MTKDLWQHFSVMQKKQDVLLKIDFLRYVRVKSVVYIFTLI